MIQQVMATGEASLPDRYMNIVRDCLRDFAQKVYNTLKEKAVDQAWEKDAREAFNLY